MAGMDTVIFPVHDVDKAKPLYTTLLGIEPYMDQPYYVGYRTDDQEIGLDPNGHAKGMTGPVGYVEVADIAASLAALVEAGASVKDDVNDVGGGKLIATVTDPDGNILGLAQSP
jgi:predicted enzyme related to lactoylglutathione lyase